MLIFRPKLWPGAMSGSGAQLQAGFVLRSMAPVAIRGCSTGLGSLQPPGTMLLLGPLQSERYMLPPRSMVTFRPKLLLVVMSGSVILSQLGLC